MAMGWTLCMVVNVMRLRKIHGILVFTAPVYKLSALHHQGHVHGQNIVDFLQTLLWWRVVVFRKFLWIVLRGELVLLVLQHMHGTDFMSKIIFLTSVLKVLFNHCSIFWNMERLQYILDYGGICI